MAYIGKKPEDLIKGNAPYNSFTGDGSTTTFTLTTAVLDFTRIAVFLNGVQQEVDKVSQGDEMTLARMITGSSLTCLI